MSKINLRFTKKAVRELPETKPGVYIIKNNSRTNIFTGIAKRGQVQETVQNHFYGGSQHIPGAWLQFEQFNNLTDCSARLKAIIEEDKPKHNQ